MASVKIYRYVALFGAKTHVYKMLSRIGSYFFFCSWGVYFANNHPKAVYSVKLYFTHSITPGSVLGKFLLHIYFLSLFHCLFSLFKERFIKLCYLFDEYLQVELFFIVEPVS